jgi:MFS family permease
VLAFFALLGITNGDWLARIPALAHGLHLSNGMLGLVLLAAPAGSFAVAPVAGALVDRIGSRVPVIMGGFAVALLPISFGLAPGQVVLMAAMFAFGVVAGLLDVSMNAQAVQLQQAVGRQLMTSFHACYSFGALGGGLVGGAFAWRNVGTAADFTAVAIPLAVLAALSGRFLLPRGARGVRGALSARGTPASTRPERSAKAEARATASRGLGRRISPLVVLSLLALCSLLGEGAADGWSAVYLRDNLGTSAGFAAMGYAAFALTMAAGRLAGDRLADRFGPVALLRAGGVLAAAGIVLVLLTAAPAGALVGFAVYGAGLSCTFPQMLAVAGVIRPDRPGSAIGRVAGTGYAGLLTGPVLIGGLASLAGLSAALGLPALLALGIAVGAGYGVPRQRRDAQVTPLAVARVGWMDDKEIIGRVDELIKTEHDLRAKLSAGQLTAEEEHAALRSVEEALDQCWDLLRQRRARREFGEDAGDAAPRPAEEVEGYLQ